MELESVALRLQWTLRMRDLGEFECVGVRMRMK